MKYRSLRFIFIFLGIVLISSCNWNADMIRLEHLEIKTGKTMPSYTDCQDEYTIASRTVFKVSIDLKRHHEFLEKNHFMSVCAFKTSNHRTCRDYLDAIFGFIRDYNEIQHTDLMVSFWTSYSNRILALADPLTGNIWFIISSS